MTKEGKKLWKYTLNGRIASVYQDVLDRCNETSDAEYIKEAFEYYVSLLEDQEVEINKKHELELKTVAKNVRHKACELLSETEEVITNNQYIELHSKIMNIQFNGIKPKDNV